MKSEQQRPHPPPRYNPQGPRAPIAWYGGKYYLARWIVEHMPGHRVYVEPFGGMANVLLKKQPSEVEILNDLDGRVVNFFRVLRDRDACAELQRRCELTPYSRAEFARLCDTPPPTDPIDQAHWFFVRCRQARGGIGTTNLTPNAWATSTRTRRKLPEPVAKYLSAIHGLSDVAARFKEVVIEQMPAIDLIKKYDRPDALYYCDPPYPPGTRSGGRAATYAVEMSEDDHRQLLESLRRCTARVMISSYDSPLYSTLLTDWQRLEKATHVQLSNSGRTRQEVLWINRPVGSTRSSTQADHDLRGPENQRRGK